jgi:hypothetical protein
MKASRLAMVFAGAACWFAGAANAQQVISETSFDTDDLGGWTVNGQQLLFPDDYGGSYIGLPLGDFWGVTLANSENAALLGDLSRYGGDLEITVDIKVFTLNNWWGDPMDPSEFPLVLQIFDGTFADGGLVSVYFEGPGMPSQWEGWERYTFTIPNPATAPAMPAGWQGTGSEEEGQLPDGRTYASVLANVAEIRLTTMRPGWFYVSSFWEVGFDNVRVQVVGGGGSCPADWNGDATVNSSDISAFLTAWLDSVNQGNLNADFDANGQVNSTDISAFLTAWLQAVEGGC